MFRLCCLLIGYFIGIIQTAYIVGRIVGKTDIREHGSGNAGTTNITRVFGAKVGIVVFIIDILKGVLGVVLCRNLFGMDYTSPIITGEEVAIAENITQTIVNYSHLLPGLYGGIGVILGHNYPFYLQFRGGKGMASLLGVLIAFNSQMAIIALLIGFIMVYLTRYISVASLVISLVFPIYAIVTNMGTEIICLAFFLMAMAYYKHRENIARLIRKEENKFTLKGKA